MKRALVLALLCAACGDDRAQTAAMVFFCDPASPTADTDCGKDYLCYAAAQSVGSAFCVPKCAPDNPKSCNGACTAGGECIPRCTVPRPGAATSSTGGCPPLTRCVRANDTPLDIAAGVPDGVCLPVNGTCAGNDECHSAVFNACASDATIDDPFPTVPTSGSVCIQKGCATHGTACEPGSSCIADVLPKGAGAPDVCSPDCVQRLDPNQKLANECLAGFTCLTVAMPQTKERVCTPGFPGWQCLDDLGCQGGHCAGWDDVGAPKFKSCAPTCKTDDDCVAFDHSGNPSFVTKMTCHNGGCRNLQAMLFSTFCLAAGDKCQLDDDPNATCFEVPLPAAAAPPDGGAADLGAPPGPSCGAGAAVSGGGLNLFCRHDCTRSSDCASLSAASHIPQNCVDVGFSSKVCFPALPFVTSCAPGDACLGDLACTNIPLFGLRTCTRACTSDDECFNDAALGRGFSCGPNHLCLPRTNSGCMPMSPLPTSPLCLSNNLSTGGICVSPTGWACDFDVECASGKCTCVGTRNGACIGGRCQ